MKREDIDEELKKKLWKARGKAGAQQDRLRKKEARNSFESILDKIRSICLQNLSSECAQIILKYFD